MNLNVTFYNNFELDERKGSQIGPNKRKGKPRLPNWVRQIIQNEQWICDSLEVWLDAWLNERNSQETADFKPIFWYWAKRQRHHPRATLKQPQWSGIKRSQNVGHQSSQNSSFSFFQLLLKRWYEFRAIKSFLLSECN